ncbi:hypothetical protein HDU67_009229 [Dinochytrium kinnereticum]|nr:hypothetical protein HDU67_009229 [Dinochytrium kinnereticum]
MRSAAVVALAVASVAVVNAHYYLTVPLTRGFDIEGTLIGPCGGFEDPVNPVAMKSKSEITIAALHSKAVITVQVKKEGTSDFKTLGDFRIDFGREWICNPPPYIKSYEVDLSTAGLVDGDIAVLRTLFNGPDGLLYQCADIKVGTETLPPRDDAGLDTIIEDDTIPVELCTIPGIEKTCPAECGASTTTTTSKTVSSSSASSSSTSSAAVSSSTSAVTSESTTRPPSSVSTTLTSVSETKLESTTKAVTASKKGNENLISSDSDRVATAAKVGFVFSAVAALFAW